MTERLLKYGVVDVMRSRIVLVYTLLLFLLSAGFAYIQGDASRCVASLMNVVLVVVPLVSIILGAIHYYNAREFLELIMTQPVKRANIFFAEYLGLSSVLALSLLVGLGLPLVAYGITLAGLYLLLTGVLLTFIFTALAFLASVYSNDKAKGIGISLILWFYFAILYDGIVLGILFYFNDYPLEKAVLALTALNPIDLSRIIILMNLDISALMGYTGALYNQFFGTFWGIGLSLGCMLLWIALPVWLAVRKFQHKDF